MPAGKPVSKVKITLGGLLLLDMRKKNICLVDVIPCPGHELNFDLQKSVIDEETRLPVRAERIDLTFPDYIEIGLKGKGASLTRRTSGGKVFDRNRDPDDKAKYDYRWLLDLSDPALGGQKLKSKKPPAGVNSLSAIKQHISIECGELYTDLITRDRYAGSPQGSATAPDNITLIGWTACRMAVEIELEDGEELEFRSEDGRVLRNIAGEDLVEYLVTIDNNCAPLSTEPDFHYYYDSLTTDKGEKYGLDLVVATIAPTAIGGIRVGPGDGLVYGAKGVPCSLLGVDGDEAW